MKHTTIGFIMKHTRIDVVLEDTIVAVVRETHADLVRRAALRPVGQLLVAAAPPP